MDLIQLFVSYGPWAWIVAGFVLLGLELVLPGGILIWLGLAGVITGLASLFQPIDWPLQFLLFGGLSLITVVAWQRYSKGRETPSDRPFLNQRADRYIGREVVLSEAITGGHGRIALDDTIWRIAGPDAAAGERVRIVESDGAVLKVERV